MKTETPEDKVIRLYAELASAVQERDKKTVERLSKCFAGLDRCDCIMLRDLLNKHIMDSCDGDDE